MVEAVAKAALAEGERAPILSLVITGLRVLDFLGCRVGTLWQHSHMGVELAAVAVEEVKRV